MGGGSSDSTSYPVVPPEVRRIYGGVADQLDWINTNMPISDYSRLPPQQFSDMTDLEQFGYGQVAGLFGQNPARQMQMGYAQQLGNQPQWQGVDLSRFQQPGGMSFGGMGGGGGPFSQGGQMQGPFRQQQGPVSVFGQDPTKQGWSGNVNIQPEQGESPTYTEPSLPAGSPGKPPLIRETDPPWWVNGKPPSVDVGREPDWNKPDSTGWTQPGPAGQAGQFGMGQASGQAGGGYNAPAPINVGDYGAGQYGMQLGYDPNMFDPSRYGIKPSEQGGAMGREAAAVAPERTGHWAEGLDIANHPAMQAAMQAYEQGTLPGLATSMANAGLGRSGVAAEAIAKGKEEMALPVFQQIMSQELAQRQLESGERAQDIGLAGTNLGAGVSQRGQDLQQILGMGNLQQALGLGLRGQDIGQFQAQQQLGAGLRGQDLSTMLGSQGQLYNAMLGARGQDIDMWGQNMQSALQQGNQALQAQQMQNAALQGAGGMMGDVAQGDLQQYLAALGQAGQWGGLQRGIQDARYAADYDEMLRQSGIAENAVFGPLGGINSLIGQRTSTRGK